MILKGIVSSIEEKGVRVIFPDRDNSVSTPLKTAAHVGTLGVGNHVAVIFFSGNIADGIIIGKY